MLKPNAAGVISALLLVLYKPFAFLLVLDVVLYPTYDLFFLVEYGSISVFEKHRSIQSNLLPISNVNPNSKVLITIFLVS